MLSIGEHDLEHAVGDQRHADHGDEQRDVFAEQGPAELAPAGLARRERQGLSEASVHSITR